MSASLGYRAGRLIVSALRVRERQQRRAFRKIRERFYGDLWLQTARDVGGLLEELGWGYLRLRTATGETYVCGEEVMLDSHLALKMAGNKPLINNTLRTEGFVTTRFEVFDQQNMGIAFKFLSGGNTPVVVKPAMDSGGGQGITTNITCRRELAFAILKAGTYCEKLMIEEQVRGASYRLTYVGRDLVDAIRRDPPMVAGNGTANIRELIRKENATRLKGEPITALRPITVDPDCRKKLREQGLSLRTVLPRGEKVVLKAVVNENGAAQNHVVRKQVHPEVEETGRKAMEIFQVKFGGIDIITRDITRPLKETGGVINEVNTTPGLHHHYLIAEKKEMAHVAARVIEYITAR